MDVAEAGMGVPKRANRLAYISLLFGILSIGFGFFTGIPAMIWGYQGLYAINSSEEERLSGRYSAILGMLLGALGTILGVLFVGLLIFRQLNEASHRIQCSMNQGQIGLALQMFAESNDGRYPMAVVPGPLPPEEKLSWLTELAPYLKRRGMTQNKWDTLTNTFNPSRPWEDSCHEKQKTSNIPTYLCPSFPFGPVRETPGLSDYVGLSGIGSKSPLADADSPNAGFFGYQRQLKQPGLVGIQSTTMIAVETTVDNGPWIAGGRPTLRDVDPDQPRLIGHQHPFGGCHYSFTGEEGMNTLWLDSSVRYQTANFPTWLIVNHTRINH